MSTNNSTRRGRKPSKFYRGKLPNVGIEFILNQNTTDLVTIQRAYHKEYGQWLKESRIQKVLDRNTVVNNKTTGINTTNLYVNYNGEFIPISEYYKATISEIMSVEHDKIQDQLHRAVLQGIVDAHESN